MRTVDTNTYVSALRELVEQGREVGLLISGTSMAPFLGHERDYIYFKRPDRPLVKGDMVFYQRLNGQFIMHRIYEAAPEGFYMVGDSQLAIEGPIGEHQIFAVVTAIKRKGKVMGPDHMMWKFFQGPWLYLPLRKLCIRAHRVLCRVLRRGGEPSDRSERDE